MPKLERWRFFWKIGLRYMAQAIFYSPIALWYAWRNPGVSEVSDETFTDYMCVRSFAKFLYKATQEEIIERFPGIDPQHFQTNGDYFISDLYLMRNIPSQDGQYVATTVALFERINKDMHTFRPVAIYVVSCPAKESNDPPTKALIYPEDGPAWELAKYYTLMGCAYRIVFSIHSMLHFPMDALNAITKSILPKKHLILKMLLPHLEFSLELDLIVQTTKSSPIKNHQEYPYTGVTGTADEIADLFVDAHAGVKERPRAYPPYHFKVVPDAECRSEYFQFQMEYYKCIKKFVTKALKYLTEEEKEQLVPWSHYIEPYINKHIATPDHEKYQKHAMKHFPSAFELFEHHEDEPILDHLIAKIIWDLTVGHAGDHYDFGMMDVAHMPMRMRIPPPASRNIPAFDRKKVRSFWDVFRHRLEWRMFYIPTNVTLLHKVNYHFDSPELQKLNAEFREDLKKTEAGLKDLKIRNFLPLKKISRSIQY